MQRSAFIVALFSLFAFFSLALASPLPVQFTNELREATVDLGARELPVDHKILHREVPADTESGASLHILAREHETFEDYVHGITGETNVARDTQDLKPRICIGRACI